MADESVAEEPVAEQQVAVKSVTPQSGAMVLAAPGSANNPPIEIQHNESRARSSPRNPPALRSLGNDRAKSTPLPGMLRNRNPNCPISKHGPLPKMFGNFGLDGANDEGEFLLLDTDYADSDGTDEQSYTSPADPSYGFDVDWREEAEILKFEYARCQQQVEILKKKNELMKDVVSAIH